MPGGRDTKALREWACVVSDASDPGIGVAEMEVGWGAGAQAPWRAGLLPSRRNCWQCHYLDGVPRVKDRVQE